MEKFSSLCGKASPNFQPRVSRQTTGFRIVSFGKVLKFFGVTDLAFFERLKSYHNSFNIQTERKSVH